ncbi:histidinol-phosphate transaminase [Gulosibacter sp. 10]|uniref:histidinol-phosphate transaminase n=1 Tax=Gulosibacter sp. 10 TaxID=1255570 RepID=UPI00097F4AE2|nr:histidinol-phosphate transaminase [Gulosibacter sp. 10]SJM55698.1 Biosynthetic Aromatic amino acid aminotransferase beta [Gulosibacter sp. 10]
MSTQFRPGLEHIAAYKPGKSVSAPGGGPSYKLSSNENPFAPLPSVVDRVSGILSGSIHRYPDIAGTPVVHALAQRLDVPVEHITLGAGSVEIAGQIVHALTAPGDEVVFAWRSFEAYPILTRVAGAVPVQVPLDADHGHDLEAMAAAITERTRVIFVCNPNNPTGTVVDARSLEDFLAKVPEHVTVVIDEAYEHFNEAADSPDGIDCYRRHPNVAVLRTFSKAYGLAGLRIGYAISHDALAEHLRKVALPFGVSALAQEAAVASLEAEEELNERVETLKSERARLTAALQQLDFLEVVPSQANFVWLPLGEATARAAEAFEAGGVAVRPFPGEGIRISIGTPEANDRVVEIAKALGAVL